MKVSTAAMVWRSATQSDAGIGYRGVAFACSPSRHRLVRGSSRSFTLIDRAGERLGTIVAPSGRIELRANGATFYLRQEYGPTE